MYDRILVPTDGSRAAERALDHGADIASQYDASLHVLSVAETSSITSLEGISSTATDSLRAKAETAAESAADRVGDDVSVSTTVVEGRPYQAITEYADENGIDLVVMGTHGRQGVERAVLGSVTERVVRSSPVPVLAIQGEQTAD